jgi:RimJ/RimL family protein N-acetyltransferase
MRRRPNPQAISIILIPSRIPSYRRDKRQRAGSVSRWWEWEQVLPGLHYFAVTIVGMELRSSSLVLRPWKLDDAPAIAEACSDPEISRWLPMIPSPYGEEDALSYIGQSHETWERGEAYNFAILDAAGGQLAGSIAMRVLRFNTGHFGYWVTREARGQGVATEALETLCRWAVDDLDIKRLELLTDPENVASQRVAEKAGFQREGLLRSSLEYRDGRRQDSILFSALPDELN